MRSWSTVGAITLILASGCPGGDESEPNTTGATTLGSGSDGTTLEPAGTSGAETTSDGTSADSTTGPSDTGSSSTTNVPSEGSSSSGGEPQNLLDNPSLEQWASAEEPNTTPDLWVDCSTTGLATDAVPDTCDAVPAAPFDGLRYARAHEGEGIAQTIETVAGTTYEISFAYTGVSMCFGGTPNSGWDVLVDGVVVDTSPQDAGTAWATHTLQFVASGPTTTLCFLHGDTGQAGIDALAVFEQ